MKSKYIKQLVAVVVIPLMLASQCLAQVIGAALPSERVLFYELVNGLAPQQISDLLESAELSQNSLGVEVEGVNNFLDSLTERQQDIVAILAERLQASGVNLGVELAGLPETSITVDLGSLADLSAAVLETGSSTMGAGVDDARTWIWRIIFVLLIILYFLCKGMNNGPWYCWPFGEGSST